jgi:hypothetical protein
MRLLRADLLDTLPGRALKARACEAVGRHRQAEALRAADAAIEGRELYSMSVLLTPPRRAPSEMSEKP